MRWRWLLFASAWTLVATEPASAWPTWTDEPTSFELLLASSWPGALLILLSVVGLAVTLERLRALWSGELISREIVAAVEALFEAEEYAEVRRLCEARSSVFTRVLSAGLSRIGAGWQRISESMEEVAAREATIQRQRIAALEFIATLAPLIGLLGTALGLLSAFDSIATSCTVPKPTHLSRDIQLSLMSTALGLALAIPATVAAVLLGNRVSRLLLETQATATQLMERFREPRSRRRHPGPRQPVRRDEALLTHPQTALAAAGGRGPSLPNALARRSSSRGDLEPSPHALLGPKHLCAPRDDKRVSTP